MNYGLPTSVTVNGAEYEIRSDFRAVLDIMEALDDPDMDGQDRALAVLAVFYPDIEDIPPEDWQEAIEKCFWFIRGGEDEQTQKGPRLMDWGQDFKYICPPVSKALGVMDIRAVPYIHWWTILSGYMSLGDCFFAQVVGIRDKKARGKPLDKSEKEFYRRNRDIIDIKRPTSEAEDELLAEWLGKR